MHACVFDHLPFDPLINPHIPYNMEHMPLAPYHLVYARVCLQCLHACVRTCLSMRLPRYAWACVRVLRACVRALRPCVRARRCPTHLYVLSALILRKALRADGLDLASSPQHPPMTEATFRSPGAQSALPSPCRSLSSDGRNLASSEVISTGWEVAATASMISVQECMSASRDTHW